MGASGLQGRQLEARLGTSGVHELGILAAERQTKSRRILAGVDGGPPPLGLRIERRRGEHLPDCLPREAESVRQREGLAEQRDRADQRRVGDELGGGARSERSGAKRLAERLQQRTSALEGRVVSAREELQ